MEDFFASDAVKPGASCRYDSNRGSLREYVTAVEINWRQLSMSLQRESAMQPRFPKYVFLPLLLACTGIWNPECGTFFSALRVVKGIVGWYYSLK